MRIENFKPFDLFLVDGREAKPDADYRAVADFYYEHSFFRKADRSFGRSAFTAFDGHRALGCAGVIVLRDKGEVWMNLSEELARRPLWLTKTAAAKLATVISETGLKFIECFIPIERTVNRNWIERMGFKDLGPAEVRGEQCRHYAMGGN